MSDPVSTTPRGPGEAIVSIRGPGTPFKDATAQHSVASVLDKGVRVGKKQRSTKTMSRREIDAVKKSVASRAKKPDVAEQDAKRTARAAQARLRKRRIGATIDVTKVKGKWWAILRVPIADVAPLVGER